MTVVPRIEVVNVGCERTVGRTGGELNCHCYPEASTTALDTQVKPGLCSRRGPLEWQVKEAIASNCCREPSI